jgi:hypothetical protein
LQICHVHAIQNPNVLLIESKQNIKNQHLHIKYQFVDECAEKIIKKNHSNNNKTFENFMTKSKITNSKIPMYSYTCDNILGQSKQWKKVSNSGIANGFVVVVWCFGFLVFCRVMFVEANTFVAPFTQQKARKKCVVVLNY